MEGFRAPRKQPKCHNVVPIVNVVEKKSLPIHILIICHGDVMKRNRADLIYLLNADQYLP